MKFARLEFGIGELDVVSSGEEQKQLEEKEHPATVIMMATSTAANIK